MYNVFSGDLIIRTFLVSNSVLTLTKPPDEDIIENLSAHSARDNVICSPTQRCFILNLEGRKMLTSPARRSEIFLFYS